MAQTTFGEILREARERHGLDLATAARRLRIRPDILRAIEEGDFARMPPRGYTRNMVNAYARLVGLNPTEMTRMYLDGAYAYQVGRARNEAQPSGFDMGASRRRSQRGREDAREARGERGRDGQGRRPGEPARQNAFGRVLYEDRTDAGGRTYAEDRMHPSRHAAVPGTQYTNFYAGPKAPGQMRSKLPFVIAAGVVLVVLVVVLVLVFGNRGEEEQDVPSVPITGLTDTSNPVDDAADGGDGATQAPTPVAPDKVVFSFSVPAGSTAYIEVYEGDGGPSLAEDVAGPAEKSYDVTTTLRFVTSNPENVTLMLAGEQVTADQLTDAGGGVYTYTVDFAAYLEQWKAANLPAETEPVDTASPAAAA